MEMAQVHSARRRTTPDLHCQAPDLAAQCSHSECRGRGFESRPWLLMGQSLDRGCDDLVLSGRGRRREATAHIAQGRSGDPQVAARQHQGFREQECKVGKRGSHDGSEADARPDDADYTLSRHRLPSIRSSTYAARRGGTHEMAHSHTRVSKVFPRGVAEALRESRLSTLNSRFEGVKSTKRFAARRAT